MADDIKDAFQVSDTQFDVRVIPHHIRRKTLTFEALDAHLASLPDDADEAVECDVKFTTPFADRAD